MGFNTDDGYLDGTGLILIILRGTAWNLPAGNSRL